MSDSCDPKDFTVHGILQDRILEWVAFPFSRGSSQPRYRTQVSCTAGGFFSPAEPQGKPKNTGVSSLSLLQQIFLAQILYQLNYQRSLLKLMSIELVMPSNQLILCHPLLFPPSIFPSIRIFSNESVLCVRWPKYWSFSFSISLSNECSGLISFRMD